MKLLHPQDSYTDPIDVLNISRGLQIVLDKWRRFILIYCVSITTEHLLVSFAFTVTNYHILCATIVPSLLRDNSTDIGSSALGDNNRHHKNC